MAETTPTGGGTRPPPTWLGVLVWVACLTSLTAATAEVVAKPAWNLDGVFYSALMRSTALPGRALHRQVYADLERQIPQGPAEALTRSSKYRRALHRSPDAFVAQLPFYVGKPLYLWLGRGLTTAGVSSVVAPHAVSAACFALLGLLLPLLAVRAGAEPLAAAGLAALAVWLPELRELGKLATPDALATLLIALGALLSLTRMRLSTLVLATAVLARPDAAILALGVLLAGWLREPTAGRAREALALGAVVCLVAALAQGLSGAHDWSTVMRHTFIAKVVEEVGPHHGLSAGEYWQALTRGLDGQMSDHPARVLPYLGLAALAAWRQRRRISRSPERGASSRPAALLLAAIWGATALRFLAMPLLADRLFAPAYVCTLALACALVVPRVAAGPVRL